METKKSYIYKYKDGSETPLCIYLCETQVKNRILIMPLCDKDTENTYKLSVTNQYADLLNYKEINKECIISALFLKSRPVKVPDEDLHFIHTYIISNFMDKIADTANTNNVSLQLFENLYQFMSWKFQKLKLNILPYQRKTSVFENGIYWAALGVNVGSELNKNRPVLIWKKRCNGDNESAFSYIVIPITSKEKSKRYYMNIPITINDRMSYLRIEDMRRINIRRISRPILDDTGNIIFITEEKRNEIMEAIKKFYIFKNKHTQP